MKLSKLLITISLISFWHINAEQTYQEKLVIGCHSKKSGLFALFIGVLNNLAWCEKKNVIPVIFWDKECTYYDKRGYNGATNAWEYYFEPVSKESYKVGDKVRKAFYAPDKTGIAPGTKLHCLHYAKKDNRRRLNQLINKYIKVNSYVLSKVEDFYKTNMVGKHTIGLHLRGTDKYTEVKPISVKQICEEANKQANNFNEYQFFVATDEQALLEEARNYLQGTVICFDSFRSKDGQPIHLNKKISNKAQLGEEVLIEVLLLSRCDKYVHTCTNVSSAVLFFNPELDNVLLHPF